MQNVRLALHNADEKESVSAEMVLPISGADLLASSGSGHLKMWGKTNRILPNRKEKTSEWWSSSWSLCPLLRATFQV